MTAIGIQWHQLNETRRHNAAMEEISNLDRSSKENIATADRISRESIADKDRASRYDIASQDRRSKETIADRDRASRESVAGLDRSSRESIASADRFSRENISSLDRQSKEDIATLDRLARSAIADADRLNQYNINERKLSTDQSKLATELSWKQLESERVFNREAALRREIATQDRESRELIAKLDREYKLWDNHLPKFPGYSQTTSGTNPATGQTTTTTWGNISKGR